MKTDKLIDAIGEIDENKIMNAKVHSAKSKKNVFVRWVACAAAVAILFGLGVWKSNLFQLPTPIVKNPTITEEKDYTYKSKILLMSMQGEKVKETTLQKGVEIPLQYRIDVTDIRNIDKAQIDGIAENEKKELRTELSKIGLDENPSGVSRGNVLVRENVIIQTIRVGVFKLKLDNNQNVRAINIESKTGYGEVEIGLLSNSIEPTKRWIHGEKISLDGETYSKISQEEKDGKGNFEIGWKHSNKVIDEMNENPDIDLSSFRDAMTICIEYKDGTVESFEFDIRFTSDGTATILLNNLAQKT